MLSKVDENVGVYDYIQLQGNRKPIHPLGSRRLKKPIGNIDPVRMQLIPQKYWAQHEFCFHLHDNMASLLVEYETQNYGEIAISLGPDELETLNNDDVSILDYLAGTGRGDLERRVVINHICIALF